MGKQIITIPAGVTVTVKDQDITVKGPKGVLVQSVNPNITVEVEGNECKVSRVNDEKQNRAFHGLYRSLINNMVIGVTQGYTKTLEIAGFGYRAAKAGNNVNMTLGFSHPVVIEPPTGITIDVPAPNRIIISGINKEAVGAMAAQIRSLRKPEPYKGKGIKYEGEVIRRKAGKSAGKGK